MYMVMRTRWMGQDAEKMQRNNRGIFWSSITEYISWSVWLGRSYRQQCHHWLSSQCYWNSWAPPPWQGGDIIVGDIWRNYGKSSSQTRFTWWMLCIWGSKAKYYTTSNCLPDKLQTHILLYWFWMGTHENNNFKRRCQNEGFVHSSFNNISKGSGYTASNEDNQKGSNSN